MTTPDPAVNPPMVLLLAPWIQIPLPPAPPVPLAPTGKPMLVCWTRLLVAPAPRMFTPVPEIDVMVTDCVAPDPPTMLLGELMIRTPSLLNPLIVMSCRFALPN